MKGKVVLITGAGSGFGAETAALFAQKGCLLALVDKASMEGTETRCVQAGLDKEQILLIQADLTVMDELKEIPGKVVERFGRLDVLVNNAGIAAPGDMTNTEEALYDRVMEINCKAVFFLSQFSYPYLVKTKGNIVNLSSVYGCRPTEEFTAYCVSKTAVNQITECAALQYAPQKVRVNAVNPGHCRTNIFAVVGMDKEDEKQYLNNMLSSYPLGRIAETQDIAKAIAFLADDSQASFITGVCLPVDGGFLLRSSRK